jgi:hypothetical protein
MLAKEIRELTKELKTTNSFSQKFLLALVNGFGTVIGATVLIAILIFILSKLANIEFLKPFVQTIVETVQNAKK